ncbi:MAG: DUF2892 domain-containing protein [Deltaproteobacteria bacterium]|nr:DUF2892 domain-containing protein [Deltaproteobacteria bacterium]
MEFKKNIGKKESILRIGLGVVLLLVSVWLAGWARWIAGLAGLSLIVTAVVGT